MELQRVLFERTGPDLLDDIRDRLAAYRPRRFGAGAPPATRPASVLIPLLNREEGCTVLFTQRTPHLNAHAGQVSFPGGGADAADTDAIATALREAQEEIGLPPGNAQVLGTLDEYLTHTGYCVTPVVARVEPPAEWNPDRFEVAAIFEVPLSHILDCRKAAGREILWQEFRIWGATAEMLGNFMDVIADERV